jgi:hypothetical protein
MIASPEGQGHVPLTLKIAEDILTNERSDVAIYLDEYLWGRIRRSRVFFTTDDSNLAHARS